LRPPGVERPGEQVQHGPIREVIGMKPELKKRDGMAVRGADPEEARSWPHLEPAVDAWRDERGIVLELEMPGVDKDSIDIQVERDVLTVVGRGAEFDNGDRQLSHQEFRIGDYHRVFTLPDDVDRDRVEATIDSGVLRLRLPLAEVARPRRIEVKGS
jgi:HSP20 family protein